MSSWKHPSSGGFCQGSLMKFPTQKLSQVLGPSGSPNLQGLAYSVLSGLHPSVMYGWEGTLPRLWRSLPAENRHPPCKQGELQMVQEASCWLGICFLYPLKPSCLVENFKCWVERCLAWACFWVPGIQLFCLELSELGCRCVAERMGGGFSVMGKASLKQAEMRSWDSGKQTFLPSTKLWWEVTLISVVAE